MVTNEISPEDEPTTTVDPGDEVEGFGLLDFKPMGKVPTPKPADDGPQETITFVYGSLQVRYQPQTPD